MAEFNDNLLGSCKVAKKTNISLERLKYWERLGAIKPKHAKCKHGMRKFRRYSQEDVLRIIGIKELIEKEGYSLRGAIKKLEENGNNN